MLYHTILGLKAAEMAFMFGRDIHFLGETDPFHENWNRAWSNGYLFAEAMNHPWGNRYVPGNQHGPQNRYVLYTDCCFPKSITQLGEP